VRLRVFALAGDAKNNQRSGRFVCRLQPFFY